MISQGLEDFLTYLRETEQQMHMAAQSEQEANDATQDILHRLELCDIDGETAETLALKLQAVRRSEWSGRPGNGGSAGPRGNADKRGKGAGNRMDHEAVLPDRVREPGSVLVIRLPIQNEVRSLQNYRRYVLESIAQGILVLGKDVTYCVEQLGWIPPVVLGEEPPVPEEPEPSSPQCTGRNAAEKRRIFERLQLFRGANGLGCLRRISDKCTFGITDDLLRDILTGNASPTIKEWREIGRALDELEGKGAASE